MEAVILAGGLGTRLRSRVAALPKAMAPVAGRAFLEYLLDQLIDAGCARLILSVGYMREVILESFRHNYRGMQVDYAIEETPLGTGGAIRLALERVQEPSVLVLNGDTYLNADFAAMFAYHRREGRPMTLAVTHVEDTARYGGVLLEGQRVAGFFEKGRKGPGWINAGSYVLSRDFPWPAELPRQFSFETDVIVPFVDRISPAAFPHAGLFLDIGVPEDFDRAQEMLAHGKSKESQRGSGGRHPAGEGDQPTSG
jgi:D-glycero-alpha-D-manno-heptose 1-phosphate guanylyltransferase